MSTSTYKNILLIGASGNLGKPILSALRADSTFNITVLSRVDSAATFPSDVKVIKADYSNKDALVKAFTGQDVVISAVASAATTDKLDKIISDAALQAGVKWIIPTEFGPDTSHPASAGNLLMEPKIANADFLEKNQSAIAHTFVVTGFFLEWAIDNGVLGFDIANHTATLYDDGKHLVSGNTLDHIGKAVAAILRHPELTLNKRIYVTDATFTQQQALSLFEKYTKTKWTVKNVATASLIKEGAESIAKGDTARGGLSQLLALYFGGHGAGDFENKSSNKALGLETSSLENIIKEAVERNNATKWFFSYASEVFALVYRWIFEIKWYHHELSVKTTAEQRSRGVVIVWYKRKKMRQ